MNDLATDRARSLTVARLLSGRPVYTSGRLLADYTREAPVLLDPETGGALAATRLPAFILSTEREATDGNIVRQQWDLSRAATVGIPILWAHRAKDELLGQWREVTVRQMDDGPKLIGRTDFDMDLPIAAEKAGQVRRGYVRAVSIGWGPGAVTRRGELPKDDPLYRAPEDGPCGPEEGLIMGTPDQPNRLFETSLVPVPADDGAFAIERAIGRAERALGGMRVDGAPIDLDAVLAAVAGNHAARAFLDTIIARHVERVFATRTAPAPSAPTVPTARPGLVTFLTE